MITNTLLTEATIKHIACNYINHDKYNIHPTMGVPLHANFDNRLLSNTTLL